MMDYASGSQTPNPILDLRIFRRPPTLPYTFYVGLGHPHLMFTFVWFSENVKCAKCDKKLQKISKGAKTSARHCTKNQTVLLLHFNEQFPAKVNKCINHTVNTGTTNSWNWSFPF